MYINIYIYIYIYIHTAGLLTFYSKFLLIYAVYHYVRLYLELTHGRD